MSNNKVKAKTYANWTKNIKDADKEKEAAKKKAFEQQISQANLVLIRLKEMIEDKHKLRCNDRANKEGYLLPNWELRQADCIGSIRSYEEILKHINDVI